MYIYIYILYLSIYIYIYIFFFFGGVPRGPQKIPPWPCAAPVPSMPGGSRDATDICDGINYCAAAIAPYARQPSSAD